jgi:hypothetical protein
MGREDEMWAEIIRRFEAVHGRDAVKIVIIREGEEYPEGTPLHPGDKVVLPGPVACSLFGPSACHLNPLEPVS